MEENFDKPIRIKRFVKPSIEEIKEYCIERNNTIDPEQFFDYYESVGWKVGGKSSMKDWKACIRTWERNDYHRKQNSNQRIAVTKSDNNYKTDF